MIVDTSALLAVVKLEDGAPAIAAALASERCYLPAPALVEFRRVCSRDALANSLKADQILAAFTATTLAVLPFTANHAEAASLANRLYGIGSAPGGTLNLLDLMVYASAKVERLPILCTGRDYAATDIPIHPASRP